MKLKFILLCLLLLFARGCDFYSTSLWFFDNPSHETNPLVQYLGFGWTGLILTNLVLVGLIIYAHYRYTFRYSTPYPTSRPGNLQDFVSQLYFNEKGKFHQLLYKLPKNRKVMIAHLGYILLRVLIIASLLATMHNLCQYYSVPVYDAYREVVKRPLFVIYGLIVGSFVYVSYRLWKHEYDMMRAHFA